MGKTVHVASKYEVEYGGTEAFNWKDDKFYNVLGHLGATPNNVGAPDDSLADVFECDVESYQVALDTLKQYVADPDSLEYYTADEMLEYIEACGETPESLLQVMQSYYDEADKRDGYLHFASW